MREYVLTLLAAAAITYLLTPLVRRFAIAVGAMHAARDRDVHMVPTPLLGGFAMYAGLAAGLLVASQLPTLNSVFAETNMAKGLLLAGGLVVVMGFVDDRWGMGVVSKLAGQVAAGVILVWSGAEVTWLPAPNSNTLSLTSDQQVALTILIGLHAAGKSFSEKFHQVGAHLLGRIIPGVSSFHEKTHDWKKHAQIGPTGAVRTRLLPASKPL